MTITKPEWMGKTLFPRQNGNYSLKPNITGKYFRHFDEFWINSKLNIIDIIVITILSIMVNIIISIISIAINYDYY